jgi:hypothetical protein
MAVQQPRVTVYVAEDLAAMWNDFQEFLGVTGDTMSSAMMTAVSSYEPFRLWRAGKEAGRAEMAAEVG